jgi:hypothetical protein
MVFAALALSCALVLSCVSERQYRTSTQAQPYDPKTTNSSNAIIEVAADYTLGYVEFDDQGWLYGTNNSRNRLQIDAVTDRFAAEGETNSLLIVVFVHGWKHNASGKDQNVLMFHKVLNELGRLEEVLSAKQHHPSRRVVGVFVGWRGLSTRVEPFKELSFWDRKNTAEVVGHGAVIELLSQLEALRNQLNLKFANDIASQQRPHAKLVILGHSFGGDIVYSAVAPVLTERMVEDFDQAGQPQTPKTLGDLVVLINPAFEAARFEPVQRLAATKSFPAGTNCTLAVFTSTADWATGLAFPIGRRLSTVFETYEDSRQRKANITAIGHYAPYINYTLNSLEPAATSQKTTLTTNDVPSSASAEKVLSVRSQVQTTSQRTHATTNDLTYNFTRCQMAPTSTYIPNDPVFNVAVAPAIIPDHDTIDRWIFIRFLCEFVFSFSSSGEK